MTVSGYTDISICNAALDELGVNQINSIVNPETDVEASCARLYPLTIGGLLSRHPWNFAQPLRQLAVDADATPAQKSGYEYAYRLPSDLIAGPFAVYADGNVKHPIHDYMNVNGYILASYNRIDVRYRHVPPVERWPIYFIDLAVMALAARLAKPVTGDNELATEKRIIAFGHANSDMNGGLFAEAKRIDAISRPIPSLFQNGDPITATRY